MTTVHPDHDPDRKTVFDQIREAREERVRSTDVPDTETMMNQRDRWDRPDRGEDHDDTE